jgi:hypothetical protein
MAYRPRTILSGRSVVPGTVCCGTTLALKKAFLSFLSGLKDVYLVPSHVLSRLFGLNRGWSPMNWKD